MSIGSVALRVDANEQAGLGHLRRSLTLCRQLRSEGYEVGIIGRNRADSSIEPFAGDFAVSWLEDTGIARTCGTDGRCEEWDARCTLAILGINRVGVSWVVVDSYELGACWEETVGRAGHRILAMDDLRDHGHFADILVSDSGVAFNAEASGSGRSPRILNGPEYCLLDPAFAPDVGATGAQLPPKRLLVSYGGSDPTGETLKILGALKLARTDRALSACLSQVDVVVGPTNTRGAAIVEQAKGLAGVKLYQAPASLAPLMRSADVILCAGGNSMIEAVAMRKPGLVTVTAKNQESMVAKLSAAGLVSVAGRAAAVAESTIVAALSALIEDYAASICRLRNQTMIDLHGAARITGVIRELSAQPCLEGAP